MVWVEAPDVEAGIVGSYNQEENREVEHSTIDTERGEVCVDC